MTTYEVQGRRVRHLGTEASVGWVIDHWLDEGERPGSTSRTGVVMTVRPHATYATVEPFIPWGGVFGIAWEVEPANDPLARFHEALRQGSLRAEERMTGGQMEQIWPPAGAWSFIALATEGDSRDGWVRWTWLPEGGEVVVTGNQELMLLGRTVPGFDDPEATHAWASEQGWGYISRLCGLQQ